MSSTTAIRYADEADHVERRQTLSPALRASLFDVPRDLWAGHPAFRGEAEFWTEIHGGLLGASAALEDWSGKMLGADDAATLASLGAQTAGLGRRLVHHAHGHHHIEDEHFFPMFLRAFPQLARPLELLDADHKVLSEVLDSLEGAVARLPRSPAGRERLEREAWLAAAEPLHAAAGRLDRLFRRHIGDEEEICIPAMLQG